eukprot:Clim_evm6s8 gene=Clim_evmTU6s8
MPPKNSRKASAGVPSTADEEFYRELGEKTGINAESVRPPVVPAGTKKVKTPNGGANGPVSAKKGTSAENLATMPSLFPSTHPYYVDPFVGSADSSPALSSQQQRQLLAAATSTAQKSKQKQPTAVLPAPGGTAAAQPPILPAGALGGAAGRNGPGATGPVDMNSAAAAAAAAAGAGAAGISGTAGGFPMLPMMPGMTPMQFAQMMQNMYTAAATMSGDSSAATAGGTAPGAHTGPGIVTGVTAAASDAKNREGLDPKEAYKIDRRERNTAASARFRRRRREKQLLLEEQLTKFEKKTADAEGRIRKLQEERQFLLRLVDHIKHRDFGNGNSGTVEANKDDDFDNNATIKGTEGNEGLKRGSDEPQPPEASAGSAAKRAQTKRSRKS